MQNSINPSNSSDLPENSHLSAEYLLRVPWQFRQALHLNDQETIENFLNSTSLTLTTKNLLNAMLLAWQHNKKAKSSLEDLLKSTDLLNKLWVFFALSEFYLTQGNIRDSKYYCDFAIKQISNKQSVLPDYLCSLLSIWNINLKIAVDDPNKLNYQELTTKLNDIISSSDIKLVRGYSYFILGMLGKINPANTSTSSSIDNFQKAIKELENIDYYYSSLAQLEIAVLAKLEFSERKKLILSAQSNFRQLKKGTELAKTNYLLSELTSQPTITSKHPYDSIGNCLFASASMKKVKEQIESFTRYSSNELILILGQKGTGKERIANAIQQLSGKSMISYNCSTISAELFPSIMFGYRKGTFTGANEDRAGLFELAGDGILFLDEIGDLPYECQPKFLRVLQDREFARVGEEGRMRKFYGRVVAATNKDLKQMVEKELFRGDLFDRLSVLHVNLPPLNQRKEEIIPLAEFFLQLHGQEEGFVLSQSAKDFLLQKEHTGNIRGLEIDIKRIIIKALSKSTRIITKELFTDNSFMDISEKKMLLEQMEPFDVAMDKYGKNLILKAIELCDDNKTSAMHRLRLHKSRFYRLLDQYEINYQT